MKNYRITAIAFALFLGCSSVSYADQFENQGGAAQGMEQLAANMGGQPAPQTPLCITKAAMWVWMFLL